MIRHEEIMRLGVEEAKRTATEGVGGPFGAAITDEEGNVIAVASNTVLGDCDPTAHAEVNAIREAARKLGTHDLSGCTIYATGHPCPMCLSAIIWANIKKAYYGSMPEDADAIGFRDDYIYDFIKENDMLHGNEQVLELESVGRQECLELFEEYSEQKRQLY